MNIKALTAWLKKRPFTAICGGLSVLLTIIFFVRQAGVPDAESNLEQKSSESRCLKSNISNSLQLKEQLAVLQKANARIDERLVRSGDLAKNQQYFYKIESETGVKLVDLRPTGGTAPSKITAAKTQYMVVPYSCTVQGTYEQLLAFLRKLEMGEHFQRILTATVSSAGGAGDDAASADPVLSLAISIEFLGQS